MIMSFKLRQFCLKIAAFGRFKKWQIRVDNLIIV